MISRQVRTNTHEFKKFGWRNPNKWAENVQESWHEPQIVVVGF